MTTYPFAYFNGVFVRADDISFGIDDLGLLRGYGIFDFFPIRGGVPIFIEDYIDRFLSSAHRLRMPFGMDADSVLSAVHELIHRNDLKEGYARFLLTGGPSQNGFTPGGQANFAIIGYGEIAYPPHMFADGVKLITLDFVRQNPLVKTTNYVEAIRHRDRVVEEDAFDVLYTKDGFVSESSRSNFFIVNDDNQIVTANSEVLEGVTRKRILEIAENMAGLVLRPLAWEELATAKEAFMTSSTKGALGVVRVDNIMIGDGTVGPTTKKVQHAYLELVSRYQQSYIRKTS